MIIKLSLQRIPIDSHPFFALFLVYLSLSPIYPTKAHLILMSLQASQPQPVLPQQLQQQPTVYFWTQFFSSDPTDFTVEKPIYPTFRGLDVSSPFTWWTHTLVMTLLVIWFGMFPYMHITYIFEEIPLLLTLGVLMTTSYVCTRFFRLIPGDRWETIWHFQWDTFFFFAAVFGMVSFTGSFDSWLTMFTLMSFLLVFWMKQVWYFVLYTARRMTGEKQGLQRLNKDHSVIQTKLLLRWEPGNFYQECLLSLLLRSMRVIQTNSESRPLPSTMLFFNLIHSQIDPVAAQFVKGNMENGAKYYYPPLIMIPSLILVSKVITKKIYSNLFQGWFPFIASVTVLSFGMFLSSFYALFQTFMQVQPELTLGIAWLSQTLVCLQVILCIWYRDRPSMYFSCLAFLFGLMVVHVQISDFARDVVEFLPAMKKIDTFPYDLMLSGEIMGQAFQMFYYYSSKGTWGCTSIYCPKTKSLHTSCEDVFQANANLFSNGVIFVDRDGSGFSSAFDHNDATNSIPLDMFPGYNYKEKLGEGISSKTPLEAWTTFTQTQTQGEWDREGNRVKAPSKALNKPHWNHTLLQSQAWRMQGFLNSSSAFSLVNSLEVSDIDYVSMREKLASKVIPNIYSMATERFCYFSWMKRVSKLIFNGKSNGFLSTCLATLMVFAGLMWDWSDTYETLGNTLLQALLSMCYPLGAILGTVPWILGNAWTVARAFLWVAGAAV